MNMFYFPGRPVAFKRYVGLSCVLHLSAVLICWSVLKTQIQALRTTGIEVAIRTIPGIRPAIPPKLRPGAAPRQALAPALPAPRRKIGRIIEKKFKLDMPRIEPQTSAMRRSRTDDEIQLVKDRNIAKLIRSENLELIDVERKEAFKPPEPRNPLAQINEPEGEYIPQTPAPSVDVNVQFVEVSFEAGKINLDDAKWSAPVALKSDAADGPANLSSTQSAGDSGKRKALRVIKPEIPPNMGVQEPKVEVILKVVIAESGFVSAAEIERSGGYLELDNRALSAIRQWIYESAPKKEIRYVRVEYVF